MENQISFTRAPAEQMTRLHTIQKRYFRSGSYPSYKNREVKYQKKPGKFVYEWQLVDDRPANSRNEGDGNLYVADWEMISQK